MKKYEKFPYLKVNLIYNWNKKIWYRLISMQYAVPPNIRCLYGDFVWRILRRLTVTQQCQTEMEYPASRQFWVSLQFPLGKIH